jgi:hypothetical protein
MVNTPLLLEKRSVEELSLIKSNYQYVSLVIPIDGDDIRESEGFRQSRNALPMAKLRRCHMRQDAAQSTAQVAQKCLTKVSKACQSGGGAGIKYGIQTFTACIPACSIG